MQTYKDIDRDSGIARYEYGADWIEIEFKTGSTRLYRYTYASAGQGNVENMKLLAEQGEGLNSFIMRNVANRYASKK